MFPKIILGIINLLFLMFQCVNGQSSKVKIIDYYTSPCDRSAEPYKFEDRIVSEQLRGDTLQIIIKTSGNCAGINSPEAKFVNDTLWLNYLEGRILKEVDDHGNTVFYFEEAECDCCFEHVFIINGICKIPNGVYIPGGRRPKYLSNDKWYYLISGELEYYYKFIGDKFEIVNDDTVNFTDKFGNKQGLWIKKPPEPKALDKFDNVIITIEHEIEDEDFVEGDRLYDSFKCFYVDDEIKYGEIIEYYQPYNIMKYRKVYTDFNTYKEAFYDMDGNVIKINEFPSLKE